MKEESLAQSAGEQQSDSANRKEQRPSRTLAEWVTFGMASLVVSAIAGLVIFNWATERDRPPAITIQRPEGIRQENGQFYVPFEIANTGGETAESVQIIAELEIDGKVKESGDVEIDFLASGERSKGAFVFRQNPNQGQLTLRVGSYKEP